MTKNFTDEFAKVCVAFHDGMEMYERTLKVLTFLGAHRGQEFSPIELADALGYGRESTYYGRIIYHEKVVKPLHWLLEMGFVERNAYTERITIDLGYKQKVKDVKIINGVEYVGYIYKSTKEVDKVSYKWFVR